MGNQVSGRPLDPGANGREVAELKRAVAQLQRLMAKRPKIPDAPAGGGIVDIAKIDTTATYPSFAGIKWDSGQTESQPYDTTYGAATSMIDGGTVSWLGSGTTPSDLSPTEDGFYQAWCYVTLTWAVAANGPGSTVNIYLNGRDTPSATVSPVLTTGSGQAYVAAYVVNPNEWMTTSDYWRVEVQSGSGDPTGADVQLSQASWRITKYGAA